MIAVLNQVKKNMASDRKGAALEKLDRARQELELLRKFGGDPKTVARVAKRIAEEIRAAAAEYADALKAEGGGDTSAADRIAAPPEQGAVQAADSAKTGEPAANPADAAAKGDAPVVGQAAPAAAANQSQEPTKETNADAARQKTVQAYQDAAARSAAKANKARGEQETLAKFKDAAREAKRLIEEAARKLKAKNPSDPDAQDAERAKAGMDGEIQQLSETLQTQQDGGAADVGALVGVTTSDAGSSVVDILT